MYIYILYCIHYIHDVINYIRFGLNITLITCTFIIESKM